MDNLIKNNSKNRVTQEKILDFKQFKAGNFFNSDSIRGLKFFHKAIFRSLFRSVAFIFVIVLVIVATSCLTSEEKIVRTPELELSELNSALANLESKGFDIDTTDLGIYYVVHTEGAGSYPQAGDTLFLEYAGYLLDGTLFDASQNFTDDGIWKLDKYSL